MASVRFLIRLSLIGCVLFTLGTSTLALARICRRPLDAGAAARKWVYDPRGEIQRERQEVAPARAEATRETSASQPLRQRASSAAAWFEGWLRAQVHRDGVSFWFHATLGGALDAAHCDSVASGAQWIRAAYHTRTPADAERVAAGLRRAMQRARSSGSEADWERPLCAYFDQSFSARQRTVLAAAGVRCALS